MTQTALNTAQPIPGTTIFDGAEAMKGYALNQMCYSFNKAENRAAYHWLWVKYGVDFIKENGQWKIWHLQVFPVFNTPYNQSITESARSKGANQGQPPAPPPGPQGQAPGSGMGAASGGPGGVRPAMQGPKDPLWIYDGKTAVRGPYVPEPHCSYDPDKSSAQYADYARYVAP